MLPSASKDFSWLALNSLIAFYDEDGQWKFAYNLKDGQVSEPITLIDFMVRVFEKRPRKLINHLIGNPKNPLNILSEQGSTKDKTKAYSLQSVFIENRTDEHIEIHYADVY